MTEQWREIYGGRYEVSDLGRVRSWVDHQSRRRTDPLVLAPTVNCHGYLVVSAGPKGKTTQKRVHALVLAAFAGPRPHGLLCRHLDGDKSNNRLSNLCWGTPSENNEDQRRHGTLAIGDRNGSRTRPASRPRGERHYECKLSALDVVEIRRRFAAGETRRQLARAYEVAPGTIWSLLTGASWSHVKDGLPQPAECRYKLGLPERKAVCA